MGKRFGALVMALVCAFAAHAQDIHFSQFHVSPMLQNPTNAGFFNCNYRFTAIHRTQWQSIGVPYKTFAGSFDMRFLNRRGSKDIFGAGLTLFNDKAGDADLTQTNISGAAAFHKNLDRFGVHYFGGGLMLGYSSGSVDFFRLLFPDMYQSPGKLQPTQQTPFEGYDFIDASMGLSYNWIPEERNNHLQIGAALHHVNQPQKTLTNTSNSRVARKLVVHASGQVRLDEHFELYPKINYAQQEAHRELMIGTFGRLDLDKMRTDRYGVYLGLWSRIVGAVDKAVVNDALVIVTRLDIKQISVAFSYDINTSELKRASQARGGPEFSVIYIGCLPRSNQKAVFCPRF